MTERCNVDFQFFVCAPDEPADAAGVLHSNAAAAQPVKRRRLAKKTAAKKNPGSTKAMSKKWLYGRGSLQPEDAAVVENFQAASQNAFPMDFYITKCQGIRCVQNGGGC